MKTVLRVLTIALFSLAGCAYGQEDKSSSETETINAVIEELFNAYRSGDSARVAAIFTEEATIQSVFKNKDGIIKLSEPQPAAKLVNYIGAGLSEVHDERIWETEIFHDEFMAVVWTKYAFYLGKKFTHCGTEVFNLRKVEGDWKIFYVADTRQTEGCNIPARVK